MITFLTGLAEEIGESIRNESINDKVEIEVFTASLCFLPE